MNVLDASNTGALTPQNALRPAGNFNSLILNILLHTQVWQRIHIFMILHHDLRYLQHSPAPSLLCICHKFEIYGKISKLQQSTNLVCTKVCQYFYHLSKLHFDPR